MLLWCKHFFAHYIQKAMFFKWSYTVFTQNILSKQAFTECYFILTNYIYIVIQFIYIYIYIYISQTNQILFASYSYDIKSICYTMSSILFWPTHTLLIEFIVFFLKLSIFILSSMLRGAWYETSVVIGLLLLQLNKRFGSMVKFEAHSIDAR